MGVYTGEPWFLLGEADSNSVLCEIGQVLAGMEYLHSGETVYEKEEPLDPQTKTKYRVFHGDLKPVTRSRQCKITSFTLFRLRRTFSSAVLTIGP